MIKNFGTKIYCNYLPIKNVGKSLQGLAIKRQESVIIYTNKIGATQIYKIVDIRESISYKCFRIANRQANPLSATMLKYFSLEHQISACISLISTL